MTPAENLLSLFRRRGYEYAPVSFCPCPALEAEYHRREDTEQPCEDFFEMPMRGAGGLRPTDGDTGRFLPYHRGLEDGVELDDWGVGYRYTPSSMHMSRMLHPLENAESVAELEEYPYPSYSPGLLPGITASVEEIHSRGLAAVGQMQCTVWETAWYMRGMENLMMDMLTDAPMAWTLLDHVTDIAVQKAVLFADAGVDLLYTGDDVGMQGSIMMSEALYAEWLQPRLARIISAAKARSPSLLVHYHTCGYVEPLIPRLIDAGIDILDPVQPECMDFERVHALYGDRLSFTGTIGTQTTMPFGTPDEVRRMVFRNLDIAGKKGGLLASPTHVLEPEVPWENVRAYIQACRDYAGH